MIINLLRNDETAVYAAEELKKYLDLMCEGFCVGIVSEKDGGTGKEIKLGLLSDFGLSDGDVYDVLTDDVMYIDINEGNGIIAGSNIRSILLSVYEYLKAAGCRFLRPGKDGEYIPKCDMNGFSLSCRKKADYPFRGECIEGAVGFEHLRDTIIWSPKVGMNMFMMEQIVPYNYISRWYKHEGNAFLSDENVSFEKVGVYVHELERLIKKCGLQLHALGHGYLLEPYGIHYKTINDKYELSDEARRDVALVNGKRELFMGSPNFTHLCYSNKKVRKKLIDFLVEYINKKPYTDFLHVWLADATDNQCECENCKNERVSDLYVMLLNELDMEFTRLGIETRIVFILYVDTLWAPVREKIKNPDRFIMMTAIGGRDYSKPYDNTPYPGDTPPYIKNHYNVEQSFPLRMRFIDDWKPFFDGRKMIYEYHMYVHQYNDPGQIRLSKLFLQDIKNISEFNLQGIMSDQTQRSFFPTGLPMSIYGAASFDKSIDFDEFADDYFKASYGADYLVCKEYLEKISSLMSPDDLQLKMSIVDLDGDLESKKSVPVKPWIENKELQKNFADVQKITADFRKITKEHMSIENNTQRRSWELLYHHTDFCARYAEILLLQSEGNESDAKKKLDDMIAELSRLETRINAEFDLFLFAMSMNRRFSV